MIAISMFTHSTYMDGSRYGKMDGFMYPMAMALCIFYPYVYDTIQLIKMKHKYFYDPWNISDFIYQYCGIINICFQFTSFYREDNLDAGADPKNVILLSIVLIFALLKTMQWLRIFDSMSVLICMIK